MKLTVFSALLATVLVALSAVEALESKPSSVVRRHHIKQAKALEKRAFSGKATWYGVNSGDLGACGNSLDPGDFFVALNQGQYGDLNSKSSYCGKTITISNGVKTHKARILDACPKGEQCHWGALDMSRSLFEYFNDFGVGVFDITWWIDGDDDGSSASSSSSSSSSNNNSNSSSNQDNDDKDRAAAEKKKKQEAAEKKAEEEKKEAAAEKKKKEAAEKKKKEEEEEKKKEAAKKKKEAAKKKKAEAKKNAEKKVKEAQSQNIAAFGEIMQTLNRMVESAVDSSSAPAASASA